MAAATDPQVQKFADEWVRPIFETVVDLQDRLEKFKAASDDVYAAVSEPNPTWTDTRTDSPPHLLTPGEVGNLIGFVNRLVIAIGGDSEFVTAGKAVVRLS